MPQAASASPSLPATATNFADRSGRSGLLLCGPGNAFPMNPASKPAERQSMAGVRLRKHAEYQRAYEASRKRQSASMSWFLAPQSASGNAASTPRVGLTAGKVLGKAHERNRIKRRMREVIRRHVDLLPAGCDLIFHPRRTVLTMEFAKLEAEIVRILEQAQIEQARTEQARIDQSRTEAARQAAAQP